MKKHFECFGSCFMLQVLNKKNWISNFTKNSRLLRVGATLVSTGRALSNKKVSVLSC